MEHLTLEPLPNGPNPAPEGQGRLYFDGTTLKLKIGSNAAQSIGSGGVTEAQMNAAIAEAVAAGVQEAITAIKADATVLAAIISAAGISPIADGTGEGPFVTTASGLVTGLNIA